MRVFVTGIRGFLGSRLAERLRARGHDVAGSTSIPHTGHAHLRLAEPVPAGMFGDADIVIHCAHDMARGSLARNVEGHKRLHSEARPRRQIYISSYSARPDAASEYGMAKYQAEQFFLASGEAVVRPGLVIGNGGLFGRTLARIERASFIPLVHGGRYAAPVVALADVCHGLIALVEGAAEPGRAWNLATTQTPSARELVEAVCAATGRRPVLLPVPYWLASASLAIAESLRLTLPVSRESLRGVARSVEGVHTSHLMELIGRETNLEQMIRAALCERQPRRGERRPPGMKC